MPQFPHCCVKLGAVWKSLAMHSRCHQHIVASAFTFGTTKLLLGEAVAQVACQVTLAGEMSQHQALTLQRKIGWN